MYLIYVPDIFTWSMYLIYAPDIFTWSMYLIYVPDIFTWSIYLIYVPDLFTWLAPISGEGSFTGALQILELNDPGGKEVLSRFLTVVKMAALSGCYLGFGSRA
jgi:hypothetical protein